MANLTISENKNWLSCDHTFKSVANIGYVRREDKKWVTQYKGMLCVQNGDGEVMSWKLVKDVSFDSVASVLADLNRRLGRKQRQVSHFIVDNCCQWRNKLQSIFGNHLIVKLDVFHAIQRVSKKIPKRHHYHSQCIHALKLVFRDPSDRGKERKLTTPSPAKILENIEKFHSQWSGIDHEGRPVLPQPAINELAKLKYHIKKGCLSNIEPNMGTNKNERLHRDLNAVFANSKYGVEYAYALLTATFYRHNEGIIARREHRDPYPIQMHTKLPHVKDVFGLSLPVPVTENDMDSLSQRSFHELTFDEIQNEVKLLSQKSHQYYQKQI